MHSLHPSAQASTHEATAAQQLRQGLQDFAQLSEADWQLGSPHWKARTITKNDFFNFRNSVCQHVGFVVKGLFRVYYADAATGLEHNLHFIGEGTFLASIKSMVTQQACPYYIGALEDAELLVINVRQLNALYAASHGWERFGRLLSEYYLIMVQARAEAMTFQSAEQRYTDLLAQHPGITNRVPLGHIASYLGIKGPSLSRLRAQLVPKG